MTSLFKHPSDTVRRRGENRSRNKNRRRFLFESLEDRRSSAGDLTQVFLHSH